MKRVLTSLILALCFASPALAQDAADANKEMIKKAAENGKRLHVEVNGNVSAEAVLIPQVDAKRIFGKEIADNYAVVEVNIGNKSPDAALIIHNVYIDYSRWALSGATNSGVTTVEGIERDTLAQYHASNSPNRIASVESRMVRGQLLDAQPSTRRNRVVKWLSLAGTLAAAYTFSLNEEGIIRGIAAYNGVAIPGLAATFPDHVIPQLNRVSDFGFRTNTVIPKEGGEIVVCFFPIDRFLTPGFRTLFLKSPALFFAPLQMLVDNASRDEMKAALGEDLGLTPAELGTTDKNVQMVLRESLPCYLRLVRGESFNSATPDNSLRGQMDQRMDDLCIGAFGLKRETEKIFNKTTGVVTERFTGKVVPFEDGMVPSSKRLARFLALDYLSQASLNNVRVTVDGVMTVDTMSINAKIDGVTFDDVEDCGGADKQCFWDVPEGGSAVRTGTIHGAYLTSGNVNIDEAAGLHIEDVKPMPEGSSDQELHFTMTLKQDVPSGKHMTFKVTKPRSGAPGTVDSQPWTYVVGYLSDTPTYKVEYDAEGNKLNVSRLGAPFTDADVALLSLALVKPDKSTVKVTTRPTLASGKAVFDFPAEPPAGCWRAMVQRDAVDVDIQKEKFEVPPGPLKLTKVAAADGLLAVEGENFVDTSGCDGKALRFQLVEKKDDGSTGKTFELNKVKGGKFVLPDEAKPGTKWIVQVRRGSDPVGDEARKDLDDIK